MVKKTAENGSRPAYYVGLIDPPMIKEIHRGMAATKKRRSAYVEECRSKEGRRRARLVRLQAKHEKEARKARRMERSVRNEEAQARNARAKEEGRDGE